MNTVNSELFTVVLEFDKNLTITGASPLIQLKAPEVSVGENLRNVFEIHRPSAALLGNLRLAIKSIFLLISSSSRYPIRGQVIPLAGHEDRYQLLGAPWLSRLISDGLHEYNLSDFSLHDGQLDGLMLLSTEQQNVRDLQLLAKSLEESQRATETAAESKSHFFTVMSHEMRTPLNAIIGSLRLMGDDELAKSQRELLEMGLIGAEQLLELINDVLDISKMEAGKLHVELAPLQLSRLIQDIVTINMPRAMEKGIFLGVMVDSSVPDRLISDSAKLKQILLNLIGNAIKFTQQGSVSITVETIAGSSSEQQPYSGLNRHIRISVKDTGAGVAEENKPYLFDHFWTGDGPRGERASGTGLGLEIARRLTELLGGTIHFESKVNEGSRFWIDMPLSVADPSSTQPEQLGGLADSDPLNHSIFENKRLLLVEDNKTNTIIAEIMLKKLGFIVHSVECGKEAILAVQQQPYDLVLMDLGLPDISGETATKTIRKTHTRSQLKIVAFTAHSYAFDAPELRAIGFDYCITKPVDRVNLVRILADALAL